MNRPRLAGEILLVLAGAAYLYAYVAEPQRAFEAEGLQREFYAKLPASGVTTDAEATLGALRRGGRLTPWEWVVWRAALLRDRHSGSHPLLEEELHASWARGVWDAPPKAAWHAETDAIDRAFRDGSGPLARTPPGTLAEAGWSFAPLAEAGAAAQVAMQEGGTLRVSQAGEAAPASFGVEVGIPQVPARALGDTLLVEFAPNTIARGTAPVFYVVTDASPDGHLPARAVAERVRGQDAMFDTFALRLDAEPAWLARDARALRLFIAWTPAAKHGAIARISGTHSLPPRITPKGS
jgi:hypothetical protein